MVVPVVRTNSLNLLKVFFRRKELSFMSMTSWVLISATNPKTAVYGPLNIL